MPKKKIVHKLSEIIDLAKQCEQNQPSIKPSPKKKKEIKYISDMDRHIRLKQRSTFRLEDIRKFWQRYKEGYFSASDTITLLIDFYDRFYARNKEEFNREKGVES